MRSGKTITGHCVLPGGIQEAVLTKYLYTYFCQELDLASDQMCTVNISFTGNVGGKKTKSERGGQSGGQLTQLLQ